MENTDILRLLNELDAHDVTYLDEASYNTSAMEEIPNGNMENEWWVQLWNLVITPFIDHFGLDFYKTELAVNFLFKEDGRWQLQWYDPQISMDIEDMANLHTLPNDFSDYLKTID